MQINPRLREIQNRSRSKGSDWYRIVAAKANEPTEVWIYGTIGDPWGDGSGVSAATFAQELSALEVDRLKVRLNSPGGDVSEGVAIFNALEQHPASVEIVVEGQAASAASFIAMAGDKVVMAKSSRLMIHDAWGFCMGPASDMREAADMLDGFSNDIAALYVQKAGGTVEDWRALMAKDTWFSAEEAVEAGLADEIQGGKTSTKAAASAAVEDNVVSFDAEAAIRALKGAWT